MNTKVFLTVELIVRQKADNLWKWLFPKKKFLRAQFEGSVDVILHDGDTIVLSIWDDWGFASRLKMRENVNLQDI